MQLSKGIIGVYHLKYYWSKVLWYAFYRWLMLYKFNKQDIYESCSLHIGFIVSLDVDEDTVAIRSLFDGHVCRCSCTHCGVRKVPLYEVYYLLDLYRRSGMTGIVSNYELSCFSKIANIELWKKHLGM